MKGLAVAGEVVEGEPELDQQVGEELDIDPQETGDAPEGDSEPGDLEPAEPEYDYLDEASNDKYVRVTIDGEEVSVPLAEALQGYSRTGDYTRKTQELAAEREKLRYEASLAQALENAPGLTIQALAQRANVSVEEFLGMSPQQQQRATADDEPEYSDPLERALASERARVDQLEQRLEQQDSDNRLMQAVNGLKSQFNIGDEEARDVVGAAMQAGLGPQAFPMIYQSMAYQKLQAQAAARQEADQKTQQTRQQKQASATRANGQVSSGGSAASVGGEPVNTGPMSPREAVLAAMEAEGFGD